MNRKRVALLVSLIAILLSACLCALAKEEEEVERTNFIVEVKEADTGQPINQAHLTLTFREPGNPARLKRSKSISYSAKTNSQGRYRFLNIPKGTIRLLVTAEHRQSFGKEIELEKEDQVVEVKLRKPQPLL
ncbi:MAG: carboxypeptidase-like regulatory domain-containing protein [Acidobacteriia bacterium]|nr:carboxypeptidase-like regulatory domain-containing protein [Terriglobia bacterium]